MAQTGFKLVHFTPATLPEIMAYNRENGNRGFTITFDPTQGLMFDSHSIPFRSWVYLQYGQTPTYQSEKFIND